MYINMYIINHNLQCLSPKVFIQKQNFCPFNLHTSLIKSVCFLTRAFANKAYLNEYLNCIAFITPIFHSTIKNMYILIKMMVTLITNAPAN